MPVSCAALGCKNRCNLSARNRGVTFHRFPKERFMREQWEDALRRRGFSATKSCRLCSEHFQPEDFDRTGQTVRIRDGKIPTVFYFPPNLLKHVVPRKPRTTRTSKKARESASVKPPPVPVVSGRTRTTNKAKETPSVDFWQSVQDTEAPSVPNVDHPYALPSSPSELTAKLNDALARVESLEREKRNAKDRERRAKNTVRALLEDLSTDHVISEDLKEKLVYLVTGHCPDT